MTPVRSAQLLGVAGRIVKPSEAAIADPYKLVAHVLVSLNLSGIREAPDHAARRLRQTLMVLPWSNGFRACPMLRPGSPGGRFPIVGARRSRIELTHSRLTPDDKDCPVKSWDCDGGSVQSGIAEGS
jgi:hypothetical protein